MRLLSLPFRLIRAGFRFCSNAYYRRGWYYRLLRALKVDAYKIHVGKLPLWINLADPMLGHVLFLTRKYEIYEAELLKGWNRPGNTILVIGANIGLHAVPLAKQVGSKGKVYAFEPDPVNCAFLRRNQTLHNLTNLTVEQSAVSDQDGQLRLYLSSTNLSSHRPYAPNDAEFFNQGKPYQPIDVRCVTIDSYLERNKITPHIVLMDIEGGEGQAFKGMSKLLDSFNGPLFFECCPYFLEQAGTNPLLMLESLEARGFTLYQIFEEDWKFERVQPKELLIRIVPKGVVNLVASRKLLTNT